MAGWIRRPRRNPKPQRCRVAFQRPRPNALTPRGVARRARSANDFAPWRLSIMTFCSELARVTGDNGRSALLGTPQASSQARAPSQRSMRAFFFGDWEIAIIATSSEKMMRAKLCRLVCRLQHAAPNTPIESFVEFLPAPRHEREFIPT
ncbi:hypothetical protein LNQ52_00035 [Klebsiella pneumoniae subsp. pneumoniae]|nr:hypothetical protein [Klebsiella pneumoniae subsp. pneumoniae]